MDAETIIIAVGLLAVIVVLVIALIAKESREEKAETSGSKAIKYLRDNCALSIWCLYGLYNESDSDISFAKVVKKALDKGYDYKLRYESLEDTQEKDLRKWCVEQSKGYISNSFAHADILYKYITTGKIEEQ